MSSGLGDIMKQAKAMQAEMKKTQEELSKTEVIGQSGGGLVEVVMTCRYGVRSVQIDPSLMNDEQKILEELVASAITDAVRKVEKTTKKKMGGLGGLGGLGSGFDLSSLKLPF